VAAMVHLGFIVILLIVAAMVHIYPYSHLHIASKDDHVRHLNMSEMQPGKKGS
jgi:hypothetical protein